MRNKGTFLFITGYNPVVSNVTSYLKKINNELIFWPQQSYPDSRILTFIAQSGLISMIKGHISVIKKSIWLEGSKEYILL